MYLPRSHTEKESFTAFTSALLCGCGSGGVIELQQQKEGRVRENEQVLSYVPFLCRLPVTRKSLFSLVVCELDCAEKYPLEPFFLLACYFLRIIEKITPLQLSMPICSVLILNITAVIYLHDCSWPLLVCLVVFVLKITPKWSWIIWNKSFWICHFSVLEDGVKKGIL